MNFKNIFTLASATALSTIAASFSFSEEKANATADEIALSENFGQQVTEVAQAEKSALLRAIEHAQTTEAGITPFISIGTNYAAEMKRLGWPDNALNRVLKKEFETQYGIQTNADFYEFGDQEHTLVHLFMGDATYFNSFTKEDVILFDDIRTMGADIKFHLEAEGRPLAEAGYELPKPTVTPSK